MVTELQKENKTNITTELTPHSVQTLVKFENKIATALMQLVAKYIQNRTQGERW